MQQRCPEYRAIMNIIYTNEDIFDSEPYSVIVHAGNCRGSWGAGIAKQIRDRYSDYYKIYNQCCTELTAEEALGGCLFIEESVEKLRKYRKHHIVCLFTNIDYGTKSPTQEQINLILDATKQSMYSLLSKIEEERNKGIIIKDIHMPKINAGYFGVPWELTEKCISDIEIKYNCNIYIHTL